jgi:hypothetical protein
MASETEIAVLTAATIIEFVNQVGNGVAVTRPCGRF